MEVNKLNNLPLKSSVEIHGNKLIKTLISDNSVWVEKFNTEKKCYIEFKEKPIDVKTPNLIDFNEKSITLTFIEGIAICEERYSEENIDASIIKNITNDIAKINLYKSSTANKIDYKEKINKYASKGLIQSDIATKLIKAINIISFREFNHGDMLLKNIILTPKNDIAFIDWEFAGLYIKGYDFALLHTTLALNKQAQTIIEEKVKELSIETEFLINKALVIARELKIHLELDDSLYFKHKRLDLLKEEEIINNKKLNARL